MTQDMDFKSIISKFDKILQHGLCQGVGTPDGPTCIEAAITQTMGLPFNDNPPCVTESVRQFKIVLNNAKSWKSTQSRAKGFRDLGITQTGSKGVVNDQTFPVL